MRRILFGLGLALTVLPACAQTYFGDTTCFNGCIRSTSPNTSRRGSCMLLCMRECPPTPGFAGPHGESCTTTSKNLDAAREWVDLCKQLEALNGQCPSNEPSTASEPSTNTNNGFIIPDSDRRRLTVDELRGLSSEQLRIARNEIFARKGRFFKDESLKAHFSQYSWYQPNRWDVTLSGVEQANVNLIQSMEK